MVVYVSVAKVKDEKRKDIGGNMYKKCDEILNRLEQEGKIKRLDFHFPEKQPLELRLKDLLDNEVDEKYYLSDTQVNRIKTSTYVPNLAILEPTVCELRYDEGIRTFKNNLCSYDEYCLYEGEWTNEI